MTDSTITPLERATTPATAPPEVKGPDPGPVQLPVPVLTAVPTPVSDPVPIVIPEPVPELEDAPDSVSVVNPCPVPAGVALHADRHVSQTLDFLTAVFSRYPRKDFAFRLWDGTLWRPPTSTSDPPAIPDRNSTEEVPANRRRADSIVTNTRIAFIITLNHAGALRRMFLPPSDHRLGLAYTLGDFDIEGEGARALDLARHMWGSWRWSDTLSHAFKLWQQPRQPSRDDTHAVSLRGGQHSRKRDMNAIQFHYDVSNEFYSLWLDEQMVYSCGYFDTVRDSIDDAQQQKIEYICRKLRLQPGDRLLDIGCGWGALVLHAVRKYGVTAVGITLSARQVSHARKCVKDAGIPETHCKIKLLDYRAVDDDARFDKMVSVGMIEHVGRSQLIPYFRKTFRLLKRGGVFLTQGITLLDDPMKTPRQMKRGFFSKYIFPDGDLQPLAFVLQRALSAGWEVRDVECLRKHYVLTLQHWLARFEGNEEEIVKIVGMETFRLWRLYLMGAGWGFDVGLHTVYQTLFYKRKDQDCATNDIPLTRDDWYAGNKSTTTPLTKV